MNSQELIPELIKRMEARKREVWNNPNPHIKPLWEISEINTKIKELKGKLK